MSTPARSMTTAFAAVTLTATVLVGCGSSSKSSTSTSAAGAPSAAASPAGSGASSGTSGGAGTPDPCTLLTDTEVSGWLGASVKRTGPKSQNRGQECLWNSGKGAFMSLLVYSGKEFYDPKLQTPGGRSVSGIGDEAVIGDALGIARKGDLVLVVGGYGASAHYEDALRTAMSHA